MYKRQRYGKEIYLAAKAGGPEPDGNLTLRRLIEKAKKDQVPADVIKRAIDKVKSCLLYTSLFQSIKLITIFNLFNSFNIFNRSNIILRKT